MLHYDVKNENVMSCWCYILAQKASGLLRHAGVNFVLVVNPHWGTHKGFENHYTVQNLKNNSVIQ